MRLIIEGQGTTWILAEKVKPQFSYGKLLELLEDESVPDK